MRRKVVLLTVFLLLLSCRGLAWAMDFDFDDLFGDDLFAEIEEQASVIPPEEALLAQEKWDVGGNYNFSVNASRIYIKDSDSSDSLRASLGGQLYLDARPDPNFRVFGKIGLDYGVSKQSGASSAEQGDLKVKLHEFFSDFNYDNKVFFRAGKQNAKWGVGYFYSPADVISVGRIDPHDPDQDLEGPVALKVHYPRGSNNYYLYTLFDDVDALDKLAVAPKMEFVFGGTEVGVGGFYQKEKAPRLMLTASSSLGNVAVFGEAVVSKGSDKAFVGQLPTSYPIYRKDQAFFHATVGARYSHSDPDGLFNLTGAAQYYFNGEGYREQQHIQDFRTYYAWLAMTNPAELIKINPVDMSSSGRHYLALMLGWNNMFKTKFSLSASLNANLSDQSGMVTTSLSLPKISKISPSVGVYFNYGDEFTEYGGLGRNTAVFAAITLGSGSF